MAEAAGVRQVHPPVVVQAPAADEPEVEVVGPRSGGEG
jgi:hypothetical protein